MLKSQKQATRGTHSGLVASSRSETQSGDAFFNTCCRVAYEMLFNPSVDLKFPNRLWQVNNLVRKRLDSPVNRPAKVFHLRRRHTSVTLHHDIRRWKRTARKYWINILRVNRMLHIRSCPYRVRVNIICIILTNSYTKKHNISGFTYFPTCFGVGYPI
jgi:hypothetical protein